MVTTKCLFSLTFLLAVMFCYGVEAKSPANGKNVHNVKDALKMSNKELESFLRQRATYTIHKMRKQFKDAYTSFVATKGKAKKVRAEHKLEELIDQANAKVKEDIKDSTDGLNVQITPLHGKDTLQAIVSVQRRTKRSGACRSWCQHICLPSCNLACCVPSPNDNLTKEDVEKLEQKAARKMNRKKNKIPRVTTQSHKVSGKDTKKAKDKSTVTDEENNERHISKEDMEKGEICEAACRVICLPSCKFKCCITTYTKGNEKQ